MSRSNQLTIKAPSKINLYLEVTGRRPDGYHDLQTFMQKLELADTLCINLREGDTGITMSTTSSELPVNQENLAVRAAQKFLEETRITASVEIKLDKKIPIAAGLGGGSSDAAAVLNALNKLTGNPLKQEDLQIIALSIGADVPFLTSDYPASWASGVGEQLKPATPLGECYILLINPGFPVSTKWVFETYGTLITKGNKQGNTVEPRPQPETDNLALTTKGNPYILGREKGRTINIGQSCSGEDISLYNDLEKVTVEKYPELDEIKKQLLADGAVGALMSGSGPTVFGVFHDKEKAEASQKFFVNKYGESVFLTKPQQEE